jgi:hypothetical protein
MLEIFGVKGNSPCFVFFRGGFETDAAPTYLDTNFATANKHANPMSGYYTLDVINRDDQPIGDAQRKRLHQDSLAPHLARQTAGNGRGRIIDPHALLHFEHSQKSEVRFIAALLP